MWILYAIGANIAVLSLEYIYRMKLFDGFWSGIPYTIVPILAAQVCLFYLFRESPTWVLGAGVFTFATAVMRTSLSYYLGEPLNWKIALGVGIMVLAVFLMNQK